jgi:hypothetical protein
MSAALDHAHGGGVAHGTSVLADDGDAFDVFSAGRVCLLGEHSDWAGGYRRFNTVPIRARRSGVVGIHIDGG